MKVQKISSKMIKPFIPTPLHLKSYKISLPDTNQFSINLPLLLFYESKPQAHEQLEESLAKTLVQFYPLAGRFIKKYNYVDCSDQGAEFVQAEATGLDLVSVIGIEQPGDLFPDHLYQVEDSATRPLLAIQLTRFACGGTAIAVSLSHRVFDISSLATFMAAWSSTASSGKTTITPSFVLPSLLPCEGRDSFDTVRFNKDHAARANGGDIAVKRLIFDSATLASLRLRIGKPVSAGRLASAVIAKALLHLEPEKNSRGYCIFQSVDMRGRTTTPLPKHVCGNFSFPTFTQRLDADAIGILELIELLGTTARLTIRDHAEIASPNGNGCEIIMNNLGKFVEAMKDKDLIVLSNWSKIEFYETDFGWGKPVWISLSMQPPRSHFTVLLSNKEGDGIEAWLHLKPSSMRCLEEGQFIDKVIQNFCNP